MNSEFYKLYRKHQVELSNMIYDVVKRAPKADPLLVLSGGETEEFDRKMNEYLKSEEPKIRERLKELGFNEYLITK